MILREAYVRITTGHHLGNIAMHNSEAAGKVLVPPLRRRRLLRTFRSTRRQLRGTGREILLRRHPVVRAARRRVQRR